ncbi:MAG: threonine/serine dehydratase [Verrucomicrobiota bacterium]
MMTSTELRAPTFADVTDAAAQLRGKTILTPLLESEALNQKVGGRLLCKAEALQVTGSYKFRGAYNRLSRLDAAARARGVVAFSTGNFGQGIATAAKMLGIPATIIVPKDAPSVKVDNARAQGAEVLFYDRAIKNHREDMARQLAAERGLTIVPPGDDAEVIAGYGTTGLEMEEQFAGKIDTVLGPCGGGGLMAGVSLVFKARRPETRLFTVEPAGFDDTSRSLAAGQRLGNETGAKSICDAILTPMPAELPFGVLQQNIERGLVVTDDAVRSAMAQAFLHLKIVLEPAGAIALAAALSGIYDCRGKTVAVICSGSSVDAAVFTAALETLRAS